VAEKHRYERIFDIDISLEARRLAAKYGYMPYMVERYLRILGGSQEAAEFLEAVERGIGKFLRCNTLAVKSCEELAERLEEAGIVVEKVPELPHGYRVVQGAGKLGKTLEHALGLYYVQGPASMLVSYVLAPEKHSLVADVAAAPGGKTTHIAQLMENTGAILSVDKSPRRAKALASNIRRMRVSNAVVVVKNALELVGFEGLFDKALLDAPCSAEGLLPLKPERKRSWLPSELKAMHELQVSLLKKTAELVKPGGYVLYATCTVGVEENEAVVARALEELEWALKPVPTRWGDLGSPGLEEYFGVEFGEELRNCLRLYTHKHGTEGFFLCLLKKEA